MLWFGRYFLGRESYLLYLLFIDTHSHLSYIYMISTPQVAKGCPRMTNIIASASMSTFMKFVGMLNFPSLMSITSMIQSGAKWDLFSNSYVMSVGCGSLRPSALNMDNCIKLMLTPWSHSACSRSLSLISIGKFKLPVSSCFEGSLLNCTHQ